MHQHLITLNTAARGSVFIYPDALSHQRALHSLDVLSYIQTRQQEDLSHILLTFVYAHTLYPGRAPTAGVWPLKDG